MSKTGSVLSGKGFVDLFAGIGGFHLAMESVGMKCVMASEWDKHAAAVYATNFGVEPKGDLTKISEKDVPGHTVLCGGFPCQAFSISGKQRGFADTRGTLFFDVARIVREKKPEVVFLENVRNFARHDGGKTLSVVRGTLEESGYDVFHKVINAAELGFPTARQRIYIVAFRRDLCVGDGDFSFPRREAESFSVEDCLDQMAPSAEKKLRVVGAKLDKKKAAAAADVGHPRPDAPLRIGVLGGGGQGNRIYSPKGVGITLSAYGGGRAAKTGAYLVNGKARKLSTRECANLMGFPKTFKIDERPTQAYKQFGNSVVVGVVTAIAGEIEKTLAKKARRSGKKHQKG